MENSVQIVQLVQERAIEHVCAQTGYTMKHVCDVLREYILKSKQSGDLKKIAEITSYSEAFIYQLLNQKRNPNFDNMDILLKGTRYIYQRDKMVEHLSKVETLI